MHVINQENVWAALDAVRDVLLMYEGIAVEGCVLHNADAPIRFDPLMYIDAVQDSSTTYYVDIDLLRTGSAIAVVARYFSAWSEEQGVYAWKDTERFAEAVSAGRFRHLPDIDTILNEHLSGRHASSDDPWFDTITPALCDRYVRSYFRRLAEGVSLARGPEDWIALN